MNEGASYPSLKGKRIFITGGATGIGAALVKKFCAQGARVAFIDLAQEAGEALIADVPAWFRRVDVCDAQALQSSVAEAARDLGGLDGLINNAARDDRHAIEAVSPNSWRANLAVNLDPAFFAAQAARPFIRDAGGGAIINFSSINALLGPENMPAYVTAKAGLIGMTKALARELGGERIRVNTILPGWVITPRQLELWLTPEAEAAWRAQCCLSDRIYPEDVASLALFLMAEDSRMITGQSFVIDAGRT